MTKRPKVYYIIPSYYQIPKDKLILQNINVINLINSKDLKSKINSLDFLVAVKDHGNARIQQ